MSSAPPSIPGEQLQHHDAEQLRVHVQSLLKTKNRSFPGAQPVSFGREHIQELKQQEYFMCEKTDGLRCLLFLTYIENEHGAFVPATLLIDRKNNYYDIQPPLWIPHYEHPNDEDKFLFQTILDGELVYDKVQGQPKPRLMFYVFDCLVVDGNSCMDRPLDKRLGRLKEWVLRPHEKARALQQQRGRPIHEPFRIKEKEMQVSYHLERMFRDVLPRLPHGNDGLIFTCKNTPYHPGTDRHILKWKPPHENTIDFKLKLGEFPLFDPEDGEEGLVPDYDAIPAPLSLLIMENKGVYHKIADLAITDDEWEMLKSLSEPLDGRIIECYRDLQGRWKFKKDDDGTPRWRDDKKDANHISTFNSVLASMDDPVTEENLLAAAGEIREAMHRLHAEENKKRKFSVYEASQQQQPPQ
ncbi:mRNA capping enzyme, catalytic domain-containing protein [Dendryphion nanum]|uniref:mRNA-capping enzyme subunit alpha n=1 Tax=Dendryphion nanum TaxID=256645 RepID=A0A9P9D158_9PLEO|nr:mRNA capping enzyme, catalytic domain-containing protein [Dendryphion nanum]